MKLAVLFGSTRGSTRKLANELNGFVNQKVDIYDAEKIHNDNGLKEYNLLVFLAPTYGDSEPELHMEACLQEHLQDLSGKAFAIIAPGLYEGGDFFMPGYAATLRAELLERGAEEALPPLPLRSLMPGVDTRPLESWGKQLDAWVQAHGG